LAAVLVSRADRHSISLLYTQTEQYDPSAWMHGGERFPKGAALYRRDASGTRPLLPRFAATADPNISFDGLSLVFAGKKLATDPWQIWEMGLTPGSALRQVAASPDDLVHPMYLPGDRVVYARKLKDRFAIETSALDGTDQRRIFPLAVSAFPTDVLQDGRILFMSGYPLGVGDTPELYTVYSDGSGVEAYRCDHRGPRSFAKQISSGEIVFGSHKGLARFTSASANEIAMSLPAGEYVGDIAEVAPGEWLVPWRISRGDFYQIKLKRAGSEVLTAFASTAGRHLIQPVVLGARPVPKKHPSALHDWQNANLLTLNIYTSKDSVITEHATAVRVYTKNESGEVAALGSAPIEKDGSFYIQVAGDSALQFELLDSAGKSIRKQKGWFWAAKGEQRVCVGCHSGPEQSPDNQVPAILLRSTTPTNLAGSANRAQSGGN
jgi:hypothetical protein